MFTINNPWGLIAFVSVPAVIFLHYFRSRFKRQVVPALFLWRNEKERSPEGRRFTGIQGTLSLFLEVIAAILLSLLISGLSCSRSMQYIHRVIIIDDSLSMKAHRNGEYFYQRAVKKTADLLDEEGNAVYSVIRAGNSPGIIAGPFCQPGEVMLKLKQWKPSSYTANITDAFRFSQRFRQTSEDVMFITDHVPEDYPSHVRIISIGSPVDNSGIVSVKRSRTLRESENIFLAVKNFCSEPTTERISIYVKDKRVGQKEVTIETGGRSCLEFNIPWSPLPVTVRLSQDNFEEDNEAVLMPAPARPVSVFNGVPEQGLKIDKLISALAEVEPAEKASLSNCVFLRPENRLQPREDRMIFKVGTCGTGSVNISEGFLINKKHTFLRGVTLEGVIWGGAGLVEGDLVPLISAGRYLLLYRDEEDVYHINIAPDQTNFFKSVDWPVFFTNVIDEARSRLPGLRRSNFILGEDIIFRTPPGLRGREAELWRGRKKTAGMVLSDRNIMRGCDKAGIYELRVNSRAVAKFCVNFINPAESDLRKLAQKDISASARGGTVTLDRNPPWFNPMLMILIAICLVGDWYIIRKYV